MKHLLWKDAMAIRPLVTAILIGIACVNVLLGFVSIITDAATTTTWYASFWILMPNMVALGAPAVLVGSEEETGTLTWLRTLPVRWSTVADSKFLVAIVGVLVAWCASSIAMALARVTVATSATPMVQEWISAAGITYLFTFSLLLLCCGFVTAYCFRSPVAGLVAVVPLIFVLNLLVIQSSKAYLDQKSFQPDMMAITTQELLILIGGAFALLLVAWAVQRLLARRRLTSPDRSGIVRNLVSDGPPSAYRPPLTISTSRPPRWKALLWQQQRQMAWFGVPLAIIAGVCVLATGRNDGTSPWIMEVAREFSVPVIWVCVSWIGGLVFYGDSVRRRVSFFADRGVSATSIWWTRMLLPGSLCLLLIILGFSSDMSRRNPQMWVAMIVLTFAFGQLVGQWVKRPVLTFFAGPVYAAVASIAFIALTQFYPTYQYIAFAAIPVLLFASWRLTERWITGRIDFGYHWRVIAYSALSIGIPMAIIVSSRLASTPELDAAWRVKVSAQRRQPTNPDGLIIAPVTFGHIGTTIEFDQANPEERLELLELELAAPGIGQHLTLEEIREILNQSGYVADPLALRSVAVLLKWARLIREDVIAGNRGFGDLEYGAERSEQLAVNWLSPVVRRDRSPEIVALVESIPDAETRLRSRRIALIDEWNRYQTIPWRRSDGEINTKAFLDMAAAYSVRNLGFERTRADRYVDELTQLLLQQLDQGLPEYDSPSMRHRDRLCGEILGPVRPGIYPRLAVCHNWTEGYEKSIRFLRIIATRR